MEPLHPNLYAALQILSDLGLPKAQQNERSALVLLALLDLRPGRAWASADSIPLGITPMMEWARDHYGKHYKPNTRETFRRQTIHQFCQAGIAIENPDNPRRPVNSPLTVYQIEPATLALLRSFGEPAWHSALTSYQSVRRTLAAKYAMEREQVTVPIRLAPEASVSFSPGAHSWLIRAIIEEFAPRFAPDSKLIYAGDTGDKSSYFDEDSLRKLGVSLDLHGKMPDVILYFTAKNWLILVEAVTSHGPVDGKRHAELGVLFSESSAGIVYVTAFPDRRTLGRHLAEIAWETEVWVADAPSHLIHFNGIRFLGPYPSETENDDV